MAQLELKHLAPYLPYGLKMYAASGKPKRRSEIEVLTTLNYHTLVSVLRRKPILHPLSDLTKEIEVNGEKFVPIVFIGEMLGYKLSKFEVDGQTEYGWDQKSYDDSQGYSFGWWQDGGCFAVWYDCINGDPIDTVLDINTMQKLFEWHFDVFNLIPEGLAIDINTLEK